MAVTTPARKDKADILRGKGINYDTGFRPGGMTSRDEFDEKVVRRELEIIARDLHCTVVRVSGDDPQRLTLAAQHAANADLEVWFSPQPAGLSTHQLLPYFADCAARAEDLRARSDHEVVLVLGCELSAFASGFLPGADVYQRLATLSAPPPELYAEYPSILARFNAFLAESVRAARREFGGRITYACGPWEQVDWQPFDIVAVDAYRDATNAATYMAQLHGFFAYGKPVAVTEFGCCTYRGAPDRGSIGCASRCRTGERGSTAACPRGEAEPAVGFESDG